MCKFLRCPKCKRVRGPGGEDDIQSSKEKPQRISCKSPGKKGLCTERDVWSADARSEKGSLALCPDCRGIQRKEYLEYHKGRYRDRKAANPELLVTSYRKIKEKQEAEEVEDPEKTEARKSRQREQNRRYRENMAKKDPDALKRKARDYYYQKQDHNAKNRKKRERYHKNKDEKNKKSDQLAADPDVENVTSGIENLMHPTAHASEPATRRSSQSDDPDTTGYPRIRRTLRARSPSPRRHSRSSSEEERPRARSNRQSRRSSPLPQGASSNTRRRQQPSSDITTTSGVQNTQNRPHRSIDPDRPTEGLTLRAEDPWQPWTGPASIAEIHAQREGEQREREQYEGERERERERGNLNARVRQSRRPEDNQRETVITQVRPRNDTRYPWANVPPGALRPRTPPPRSPSPPPQRHKNSNGDKSRRGKK